MAEMLAEQSVSIERIRSHLRLPPVPAKESLVFPHDSRYSITTPEQVILKQKSTIAITISLDITVPLDAPLGHRDPLFNQDGPRIEIRTVDEQVSTPVRGWSMPWSACR